MRRWVQGAWLVAVSLIGLAGLVCIVALDIPAAMGYRHLNFERDRYVDHAGVIYVRLVTTDATPLQRVLHLACFAASVVVLRQWIVSRRRLVT